MGAGASKKLLTDKAGLAELILNELAQFEEENPGLAAAGGDFGPELFRKRVLLAAEDSKLKGKDVSVALSNLSEEDFAELSEMANDFIEKRNLIKKDNQDDKDDLDDNTSVLSYGDEDQIELDNYTDDFNDINDSSPLVTERQDESIESKLLLDVQKLNNKVYNRTGDSPTSDKSHVGDRSLEDSTSSIGSIENDGQIYPGYVNDNEIKRNSPQIHASIHPGVDDSPLKIETPTTARESTLWDLHSSGESSGSKELFDPTGIIPLSQPRKNIIDTNIEKYKNKKSSDNTRSPTGYYQDYGQKIDDKNESLMDLQRLKIQSYETNAKLQREVEVLQMQLEKIEALEVEMGISAIKAGNKPTNQHSNPLSLPNNKFSCQNNIENRIQNNNNNNHQNFYNQNSQNSFKNSFNNDNVNVSIETIQNSINKSGVVSTDGFSIKKHFSNYNEHVGKNKNRRSNAESFSDIEVDNLESTCISDISDISNIGDNFNNTNPRVINNKKQNPNGIRRGVCNSSESKNNEYNIADEMKYIKNNNIIQAKSSYNNENEPYSVIEIDDNDYNYPVSDIKSQNKNNKRPVIKDVFDSKDTGYNKDKHIEINNRTSETDNIINSSIDEEAAPVRKQRSKNILKNLNRRRRHTIDTNEQGDSLTEDEAYNSSNANVTDDEVPAYLFAHGSDRGSRKNAPNGSKKDGKRPPRQRQSLETLDSIDTNINRNNSNLRINVNGDKPINNVDDKVRRRKPNRVIKKKEAQSGDENITNVLLKNEENKDDQPPEKEKLWTRALDIRWGEVNLLLRKKICSEADIQYTVAAAEAGLMFTDQLNSVAKSLNVLRGTLSRWLLPYDNNTRIDEQCSTPHSVVEHIPEALKGKITERQIHYLVAGANSVRKLVRIKIADDNDLDQARQALKTAVDFFRRLSEDSTKHNITSWELLQMEE
jgi:hypothetical protein